MITLEPYLIEQKSYHKIPLKDRWIFNKLTTAERMGYTCGPVGTLPPRRGRYMVRPQTNIGGMGGGGFYIQDTTKGSRAIDKNNTPNANPGYFWSELFTGLHCWTVYINDIVVFSTTGILTDDIMVFEDDVSLANAVQLPDIMKGISRYMMLEHIGGNVIEVCPRHAPSSARQEVVDDYRTLKPAYDPNVEYGIEDYRLTDDEAGGKRWVAVLGSRRPF